MSFAAEVEAALDRGQVHLVVLIAMHFSSGTVRRWTGFGDRLFGGHIWRGLGEINNLPELEQVINGAAARLTLEMSGVDPELLARADAEAHLVDGREIEFFIQILDDAAQPVGDPQHCARLIMDEVVIRRQAGDSPGQPPVRLLSIGMASPMAARRTPPRGRYSDRDQQARYPGDRFCERVPGLVNAEMTWPDF